MTAPSGRRSHRIALLIVLNATAVPLAAQQGPETTAAPRTLCWRARPLERCSAWVVTEAIFRTGGDFSGGAATGLMINASPSTAWGLILGAAMGAEEDASLPLQVRRRRWLGDRDGFDLGVGAVLVRWKDVEEGPPEPDYWDGVTGLIGYSWRDALTATAEFDTGNATPVMIGFRTGNYVTGVLAAAAFLLLLPASE